MAPREPSDRIGRLGAHFADPLGCPEIVRTGEQRRIQQALGLLLIGSRDGGLGLDAFEQRVAIGISSVFTLRLWASWIRLA